MFIDFRSDWHHSGPWEPKPTPARLTRRQERIIGWVVGINLVMLLVAPLGGSTLVEAVIALLRR